MEEMLAVFNEEGERIGTAPRSEVHRKGLRHEVIHIWIVSKTESGYTVWLQQRSPDKKTYPGMYDIAVGGHIADGEIPAEAAVREMQEEIGVEAASGDLVYVGDFRDDYNDDVLHDLEIARVFLYEHNPPVFSPGPEVSRMVGVPFDCFSETSDSPAFTESGSPVTIRSARWRPHNGEYARLILPFLKSLS